MALDKAANSCMSLRPAMKTHRQLSLRVQSLPRPVTCQRLHAFLVRPAGQS